MNAELASEYELSFAHQVGMTTAQVEDVMIHLDDLRDEGTINMLAAGPSIRSRFSVDQKISRALLQRWMATFSERHPTTS